MLEEFSKIRRQSKPTEYLLPTGEYAINYRDCTLDILEELADAYYKAELTRDRVRRYSRNHLEDFMVHYDQLKEAFITATEMVVRMRQMLPDEYIIDRIVVNRPCLLNKEGTEVTQNFFVGLEEGKECEE